MRWLGVFVVVAAGLLHACTSVHVTDTALRVHERPRIVPAGQPNPNKIRLDAAQPATPAFAVDLRQHAKKALRPLGEDQAQAAGEGEQQQAAEPSGPPDRVRRTQEDLDAMQVDWRKDLESRETILTVLIPPPKGCPNMLETSTRNLMGGGKGSDQSLREPPEQSSLEPKPEPAPAAKPPTEVHEADAGPDEQEPHAPEASRNDTSCLVDEYGWEAFLCTERERAHKFSNKRCANSMFFIGNDNVVLVKNYTRQYRLLDGTDPREAKLGCDEDWTEFASPWTIASWDSDPMIPCLVERFPFGTQCLALANDSFVTANPENMPQVVEDGGGVRNLIPMENCGGGATAIQHHARVMPTASLRIHPEVKGLVGQCSRKILLVQEKGVPNDHTKQLPTH